MPTAKKVVLRTSLRISVQDVQPGMFIAELDRPWVETPFLIQGFVIDEVEQLALLRALVNEVTIDPVRSLPESLAHLPWDVLHEPAKGSTVLRDGKPLLASNAVINPASTQSDTNSAIPYGLRWGPLLTGVMCDLWLLATGRDPNPKIKQPDQYYLRFASSSSPLSGPASTLAPKEKKIDSPAERAELASELTPPSTAQFSRFIANLYPRDIRFSFDVLDFFLLRCSQISQFLVRQGGAKKRPPSRRRSTQRANFLHQDVPLVVYHDQTTIEEESIRAQQIIVRADKLLEKIVRDIELDLPIQLNAVEPIVDVLVDSVVSNPAALMWSTRMRDESKKTYMHGLKVAVYLITLGRHLGFPKDQLSELGSIGLLLDIGMLKMPRSLLEKAGQLNEDEHLMLMRHVQYSLDALQQNHPLPRFVVRGIEEHHERIDGSGYPKGLRGDAISIYGRMAAIADTFAAMTTARPYDVTHSAFDAMKELFREAETKLHAPLVEQFVQAVSIFPVGTLIELSSGEAAIVLEHNGIRRLEPKVLILTDADKKPLDEPIPVELMGANRDRKRILRGLADGAYGIDYRDYYLR